MKIETTTFGEYVSCTNGDSAFYLSYQKNGSVALEIVNHVHVSKTIVHLTADEFEGMRMLFHLDLKRSEE